MLPCILVSEVSYSVANILYFVSSSEYADIHDISLRYLLELSIETLNLV